MRITMISPSRPWAGRLPVEWHFSEWSPVIQPDEQVAVRPEARPDLATKPLLQAMFMLHPARRKKPFKPMKKNLSTTRHYRSAFTLIELLVVIAIIAILAAMILAALKGAHTAALKMKAKTEIADIVNAINAYDTDYGRFPVTTNEQNYAQNTALNPNGDFTTGLVPTSFNATGGANGAYSYDNNSNVVAILMDTTSFPNGNATANVNHQKNPRQVKYLNAKLSGYVPVANDPHPLGGVDNTGIYRDPWGNPYIITMDLNYDEHCADILYSLQCVSQNPPLPGPYVQSGYNGLSNTNISGSTPNDYTFAGKAMAWSAGPDGLFDSSTTGPAPAIAGHNRDNILSWQ